MAREYKYKAPAVVEKQGKHRNRLKAPKTYTLNGTYNFTNNEVKPNETAEVRHERKIERIIWEWYNRETMPGVLKGYHLHDRDIAHYDKRAAEFYRLQERLKELDPVKDYSERNNIGHKLTAIRADFENLQRYSKIHNAYSYECEKPE